MRSLFVWIQEGHEEDTKNLSQSASNEQGKDQKKDLHWNSEGFSGQNQKSKHLFPVENRWFPNKKVFVPKILWNPVWVHKNYKNTGGKHQFGPRFALQ